MNLQSKIVPIVDRLDHKIKMSRTQVPGFIIGLSGTDSIVAFHIAHRALSRHNMAHRLTGVHYVHEQRRKPTWFEESVVPWLRERYPTTDILVVEPLGGNRDQQRWADLHMRALNRVEGRPPSPVPLITPYDPGENYWTAGTINATERYLGKYSILANSVSIQLIQSMWKSEIMEACQNLGVPEIAMETARLPDCLCGREEIAAQNIELIDDVIRNRVDPTEHDPELLRTIFAYIRDTKAENDFKQRTPFAV